MKRQVLTILALAFTLSACSTAMNIVRPAGPVQAVVLAADATDASNQLAELVLQMSTSAHKLYQSKVLPAEADRAVQMAALKFADDHMRAVDAFAAAQTPLQIAAATAPMVGDAATIVAMLTEVAGVRTLTGTPGLLRSQLGPILDKAQSLIRSMGGK